MTNLNDVFHHGEIKAQEKFNAPWQQKHAGFIAKQMQAELTQPMIDFIKAQRFFFLSTADEKGHCDCSYKGANPNEVLLEVTDLNELVFPDFLGNHFYNSIGNLLTNAHAGLLFVDFNQSKRLRFNGQAEILQPNEEQLTRWPKAHAVIKIVADQIYWNCSQRIEKI